jgi:hypothetical protein
MEIGDGLKVVDYQWLWVMQAVLSEFADLLKRALKEESALSQFSPLALKTGNAQPLKFQA